MKIFTSKSETLMSMTMQSNQCNFHFCSIKLPVWTCDYLFPLRLSFSPISFIIIVTVASTIIILNGLILIRFVGLWDNSYTYTNNLVQLNRFDSSDIDIHLIVIIKVALPESLVFFSSSLCDFNRHC